MNRLTNSKWFARSVLLTAVVLFSMGQASAQDETAAGKAVAAAKTFLALMDAGQYERAWEESSEVLRAPVSKEKWQSLSSQVRGGAGTVISRAIMDGADAPKAMQNARGQYFLVKFSTSFSNVLNRMESVALTQEPDGQYRVAGYSIVAARSAEEMSAARLPPKSWLSDEEIKAILRDRIEVAKRGTGIVVGLIDEHGSRVISFGKFSSDDPRPVDGDSIFEIGSITKTFTATLLADMAERGEVALDDPISKYLPRSVKSPVVKGKEITLQQLSRHTSGLPRLPTNMKPRDAANPYADYTVKQLYAFLNDYKTTRPFGITTEYSNLGVGLLGHILALRAGSDYETLVRARILAPLKMGNTGIAITPAMRARMVTGHFERVPVPYWDVPTLAGAGALRASTNDLLKYLAAQLGLNPALDSKLSAAIMRTHRNEVDKDQPDQGVGLGWGVRKLFENDIISHDGGTGGFRSYIAFEPTQKRGVVVLSNSTAGVDDIGIHLLDSRKPLAVVVPPKSFTAIRIEPRTFDAFVGRYEIEPGNDLVFSREGERFFSTITGLGKVEIFAYEPTSFFAGLFDAQVTFMQEDGAVKYLLLHQDGKSTQVMRAR